MSKLDLIAETTKLSRLLGVPEAQLAYLQPLGVERMRALRERINAAVFDDTRPMLMRVAASSKLLPVPAIALIGEKVFGALLCARVAGLLPAQRALEVGLRLPDAFLADVATALDPRSAREVIGKMPADRVAGVAAILVQRKDFVTMGRFVDYLSREVIKAVIEGMADNAALLHVAFYVEAKAKLNDIAAILSIKRLREIVAVAESSGLWSEALSLMGHIEGGQQRRIADLAAEQDDTALTRMLRTAQEQKLWDVLLPIIAAMSKDKRERLVKLPALAEVPVLTAIVQAADAGGLWPQFLPLVTQMTEPARRAAAQCVEQLDAGVLLNLLAAVQGADLWDDLLEMLGPMDKAERSNIARLIGQQDDAMLTQLLKTTHQRGLWPKLMPLLAAMPKEQIERLRLMALKLKLDWPI